MNSVCDIENWAQKMNLITLDMQMMSVWYA